MRQPSIGCSHVLLDTYDDDPEATRYHETACCMLATMADKVLDLANEAVK